MSLFALEVQKNKKQAKNPAPVISSCQIEKILCQEGMFFCVNYQCRMQEKHCVSYQKKAVEDFRPAFESIERFFCVNCDQGKKIAEKLKVSIPEKKLTKKCRKCGGRFALPEFRLDGELVTRNSSMCRKCRLDRQSRYEQARREQSLIDATVNV